MFENNLIENTKEESLNLLRELITEKGFVASSNDIDNYKRVFSRDGVICGLASIPFKDDALTEAFKKTLLTLKENQDKTGRIPSNVSLDGKVSYGTTVGRIDASIWYIIGCCKYYIETNDEKFLEEVSESIEKTIFYLECLELNGRGLLYVPPGGDWADEYVNEGYVLFDEVLYLIALEYYYKVFRKAEFQDKKEKLKKMIAVNFIPKSENIENENVYHKNLYKKILEKYKPPVPISSFSAFGANYFYDLFAISLLFNLNILSKEEKNSIQEELEKTYESDIPIYPAFYPQIDAESLYWNDLNNNYLFRFKNKPFEYHNGGLWPIVQGFYLASKNNYQKKELEKFAEILKRDNYVFPEFYHGRTLEAMGTKRLGFSASGYLLAYQKIIKDDSIFDILI